MVMMFRSEIARSFLLQNGHVVSFRAQRRKRLGKDWMNAGRGKPKIAEIFVAETARFEPARQLLDGRRGELAKFLDPYVPESGFRSVVDWIEEIIWLNGNMPYEGWLYGVKLLYPRCPNCGEADLKQHRRKRDLLVCPLCWHKYKKLPALKGEFHRVKKKVKNPGWAHRRGY